MGAEEESPKRVASEARAPQGHRREPFLRNFLGEQKVPRRRQNARRAKKPGPQAQREQCPKGKEKCFREKPGPQAQKKHSQLNKPARRVKRNVSKNGPGAGKAQEKTTEGRG